MINQVKMICLRVSNIDGRCSNLQNKLIFNQREKTIKINNQTIEWKSPIGLQLFSSYLYVYLNPTTIVAVNNKNLQKISQLLIKCGIGVLKIPDRQTQLKASQQRIEKQQYKNTLIHCGTYNNTHDCYIIIKMNKKQNFSIEIKNKQGISQLLSEFNKLTDIKFFDQQNKISLNTDNFYFWKQLEYFYLKIALQQNYSIYSQSNTQSNNHQHINLPYPISQQQIQHPQLIQQQQPQPIEQQPQLIQQQPQLIQQQPQLIQQQPQLIQQQLQVIQQQHQLIEQQGQLIQQQPQPMQQQKYQQPPALVQYEQPNRMIEQHITYQAQYQSVQIQTDPWYILQKQVQRKEKQLISAGKQEYRMQQQTAKKEGKLMNQFEQTDRKALFINDQNDQQGQNRSRQNIMRELQFVPRRIDINQQYKQNMRIKRQQMQMQEQNQPSRLVQWVDSQIKYQHHENQPRENIFQHYKTQISCLNGSNIVDIKNNNNKYYLYSHQFLNWYTNQAIPKQVHKLTLQQNNQQHDIKATKLIFDIDTKSAYYNNDDKPYIHCFDMQKMEQSDYFVRYPVLDIVMNRNNTFLGIHSNIIFQLDTRTKVKKSILKYKSVNNFTKISAVFTGYSYATASSDGMVRTYDIRSYNKALNKFKMNTGIRSLQISSQANYILCGYNNQSKIISCMDKNNQSIFKSTVMFSNRKKQKNLIQGYQNLFHLQFIQNDNKLGQGDIIAVDNLQPSNLLIRNIQLNTSLHKYPLNYGTGLVDYLNFQTNNIVYGRNGIYYRQTAPWNGHN